MLLKNKKKSEKTQILYCDPHYRDGLGESILKYHYFWYGVCLVRIDVHIKYSILNNKQIYFSIQPVI